MSEEFAIGLAPPAEPVQYRRKRPLAVMDEEYREPRDQRLLKSFVNANPIYAKRKIFNYLNRTTTFDLSDKTNPRQIRMFLYRPPNQNDLLSITTHRLRRFRGTFQEWQVFLTDLYLEKDMFKSNFVFNSNLVSEFHSQIADAAQYIFGLNQHYRWIFKRAVGRWLYRRATKRVIGEDSDIITLEPVKPVDRVTVTCLTTRATYVYSAGTLLKCILSNLEIQVEAIPQPKQPINPYTNLAFTYVQMQNLYFDLMKWCAINRKTIPAVLSLYKESNYNPALLSKIHHNYIQYRAGRNYFTREEDDEDFFIDNLQELFAAYEPLVHPFERTSVSILKFKCWYRVEQDHYLMKQWKSLVSDYWYYTQTEHFSREYWSSENSIMMDVRTLLVASKNTLDTILHNYKFRVRATP